MRSDQRCSLHQTISRCSSHFTPLSSALSSTILAAVHPSPATECDCLFANCYSSVPCSERFSLSSHFKRDPGFSLSRQFTFLRNISLRKVHLIWFFANFQGNVSADQASQFFVLFSTGQQVTSVFNDCHIRRGKGRQTHFKCNTSNDMCIFVSLRAVCLPKRLPYITTFLLRRLP